jgi:hypothetical protein
VYRHGVFELGWILSYFTFMAQNTLMRKGIYEAHRERLDSYLARPDLPLGPLKNEVYGHLPVADMLPGLGLDQNFARTDTSGSYAMLPDLLGSTVGLVNSTGALGTQYQYGALTHDFCYRVGTGCLT